MLEHVSAIKILSPVIVQFAISAMFSQSCRTVIAQKERLFCSQSEFTSNSNKLESLQTVAVLEQLLLILFSLSQK